MGRRYCSVEGCFVSSRTKELRFFCFPKHDDKCIEWIKFCGDYTIMQKWKLRKKSIHGNYRICSLHFKEVDYESSLMNKLKKGVVPSLNGPPSMIQYVPLSPTVASSVHSASPTSDAEPPAFSCTLPNPIDTPYISSNPLTSSINLPGPSLTTFISSTSPSLPRSTSFNNSASLSNLPLCNFSVSNISAVASDDLVSVTTPHGDIVRSTKSSCKKNEVSLPYIGILKQSYCIPCKQKDLEIKRLRETNRRLKRLVQSMERRLVYQHPMIVDTQISSDSFSNADS